MGKIWSYFLDFGSFAVTFFFPFVCFFEMSHRLHVFDFIFCRAEKHIAQMNYCVIFLLWLMWIIDTFCPSHFCWSQGQCGELKIQSNLKITKVQLMQMNNWLANNCHLSVLFYIFFFFLSVFFFFFFLAPMIQTEIGVVRSPVLFWNIFKIFKSASSITRIFKV